MSSNDKQHFGFSYENECQQDLEFPNLSEQMDHEDSVDQGNRPDSRTPFSVLTVKQQVYSNRSRNNSISLREGSKLFTTRAPSREIKMVRGRYSSIHDELTADSKENRCPNIRESLQKDSSQGSLI